MPFIVEDYHDLIRLLHESPEMRAEVRRLVLTDELLDLPGAVRALTESHRRAEERLTHLDGVVASLAEAQRRTEERVEALTEAQRRTEERLQSLIVAQERTNAQIALLNATVGQLDTTVGRLVGEMWEMRWERRAPAYLGHLLRRLQVITPRDVEDALEAHLSPEDLREVMRVHLLIKGRPRHLPGAPEILLVAEVSAVVDSHDVERALRRAGLLRQAGFHAVALVGGQSATEGAAELARDRKVVLMHDGVSAFWEEAVAEWGRQ
ncbi:MAG: hypothetical protein HY321_06745 [Armatimonadetes bacterium]|nr:hypothetical protein [Armatimonadota bacterium]